MRTLVTVTLGVVLLSSSLARAQQGAVLQLSPQDQQNITAQLGAGVVGAALPSQTITDPSVYFPLTQKSQQFQVVAGPHAGTVQTLGLWQARRPGGRKACSHRLGRRCGGRHHAGESFRAQGHPTG
jgi:hypothetical protein